MKVWILGLGGSESALHGARCRKHSWGALEMDYSAVVQSHEKRFSLWVTSKTEEPGSQLASGIYESNWKRLECHESFNFKSVASRHPQRKVISKDTERYLLDISMDNEYRAA